MKTKPKQLKVKVKSIKKVKTDVFLLQFSCPYIAKSSVPGNFLHLKIEPVILRRPLSIHKVNKNDVYILFRVRGKGTRTLSCSRPGDSLDIIGPLGQGFKFLPEKSKQTSLGKRVNILIAGGIGVAPLMFLAQRLRGQKNIVLIGAKTKNDILCEAEFKKLGFKTLIATDDGSKGLKGMVVELLKTKALASSLKAGANIYSCGPAEMFYEIKKIVKKYPKARCQASFEQFMGCGLGVCCGCSIETKNGYKKVCKDGPVFDLKEI